MFQHDLTNVFLNNSVTSSPDFSCRLTPNVRTKSSKKGVSCEQPQPNLAAFDVKFTTTDEQNHHFPAFSPIISMISSIFPYFPIFSHIFPYVPIICSHIFPWKKITVELSTAWCSSRLGPPAMSSAFRPAGFPLGRSGLERLSTKQVVRSRDLLKIYRKYGDLWENLGNTW